jgi:hypothetical protein
MKLIIQVSPVSYYFLHLTPIYIPEYHILEQPQMTHTTSTITFQMLHFTYSKIHVKAQQHYYTTHHPPNREP